MRILTTICALLDWLCSGIYHFCRREFGRFHSGGYRLPRLYTRGVDDLRSNSGIPAIGHVPQYPQIIRNSVGGGRIYTHWYRLYLFGGDHTAQESWAGRYCIV